MPIVFSETRTVQLTDGNWNGNPDLIPNPDNIELSQTETFDLSGSGNLVLTASLELDVIGDFNDDGEVLTVTYDGQTAQLFDPDTTNDVWFTGESTGPTNGVDNPLLGARQPEQGNITINGDTILSESDIDDIFADTAVFTADASVSLMGSLGEVSGDQISIEFAISNFLQPDDGVDFAELQVNLTAVGDWVGDRAISNIVFYLECDGEIQKIKLDDFSALQTEYLSTDAFEFSEETLDALAADLGLGEDCDFVGLTIKAGNNREDGFRPNEARGEGEIVFGDILDDYGVRNTSTIELAASDYIDSFLV